MFGIGFALKLLGIFKNIKDFLFKHWKIALAIVLIIGAIIYHKKEVSKAYSSGVKAEFNRNKVVADAQNKKNRLNEKLLKEAINKNKELNIKLNEQRKKKEIIYRDKIQEVIKNNPIYQECKIDQSVIDYRNEIRRSFK